MCISKHIPRKKQKEREREEERDAAINSLSVAELFYYFDMRSMNNT